MAGAAVLFEPNERLTVVAGSSMLNASLRMVTLSESSISSGLIARLRSGNYDTEDLDRAERLVRDLDSSGRPGYNHVVDALIKGLDSQRYPSPEYTRAIGIATIAGSDERIIAALTELAGTDRLPLMRVDAAEALARLGDDRGVELLTAAMRQMEDEEDLSYAASRLRALDRPGTALEVLLTIASDATADAWARTYAAVVATAYDQGGVAIERLKNLAETFKEPAFSQHLAQALRNAARADEADTVLARLAADEDVDILYRWNAICSLRDNGSGPKASALALKLAHDSLIKGRRDSSITIAAAIEASRFGSRPDASRLLLRLAEDMPSGTTYGDAVDAVVEAGRLEALTEATNLLCQWGADHGRDGRGRLTAAEGLSALGHSDIALPLLSDLADDEDISPTVRASAALQVNLISVGSAAQYPIEPLAARFVRLARDRTADPDQRMEALGGLKALNRRNEVRQAAAALAEDPELGEIARVEALSELAGAELSDSEIGLLTATAQNPLSGWQLRIAAARILGGTGLIVRAASALRAMVVQEGVYGQEAAIRLMRELALAKDLAEVCREDVGFGIARDAVTALVSLSELDRIGQLTADPLVTADARLAAAEALLSDGDDRGREVLRELALSEVDYFHMAFAAHALDRHGASADAVFILRARASDEDAAPELRVSAINSLLALGTSATVSSQAEVARITRDIAERQDVEPATRLEAAEALVGLGDPPRALEVLLSLATSQAVDPETCLNAARVIAELGGALQGPCEALADLAEQGETAAHIRSSARELAVRLGCPDTSSSLATAMRDPALGAEERLEAAILAVDLGVPRASSILTALTIRIPAHPEGPDNWIITKAMDALVRRSNWRALIKIAKSPDTPDQRRAYALDRVAEIDVNHLTAIAASDQADSYLRASAALAAWHHGVRGPLIGILLRVTGDRDASPADRIQAAAAAGDSGAAQEAEDSLRALLGEAGLSDADAFQAAAAFAGIAAGDAVLQVARAPGTSVEARVWLAAWELPKLGLAGEARSLLAQLGSAPNVSCNRKIQIAREYLPRLGRTSAGVKILLDLTRSGEIGPEELDNVSAALTKIAPTDVLAQLAADNTANDINRCAAAEGLWRRGRRDEAVSILFDLAERAATALKARVKACRALIRAGARETMEIAEQLLADPLLDERLRVELLTDYLMAEP